MKKIIYLVFVVIASGCAGNPITYNPGVLPNEELAKVTFEKSSIWESRFWESWFVGSIVTVFDEAGNKVIQAQGGAWSKAKSHREVFLPEGKYLIVAYCSNMSVYPHPRISLALEKRKIYTLACRDHTEKGFLGLDMIKGVSLELLPHKN